MTRGRPAKPTNLKLLHGDAKKNPDRVATDEPQPAEGDVVAPVELSDGARQVWERIAPDRIRCGVLTTWDVDAFAEFCEALVILRNVRARALEPSEPGQASPMSAYKTAVGIVATLGGRFGWTPADRAKLSIDSGDERGGEERYLSA